MKNKWIIAGGIILVVVSILLRVGMAVFDGDLPVEPVFEDGQVSVEKVLRLGEPHVFFDGDTLVATTPVYKENAYLQSYSAALDYTVTENGKPVDSYVWSFVPYMNFGQTVTYTTCVVKNVDSQADVRITPAFEKGDKIFVDNIEDYAYLTDGNKDADAILQAWTQQEVQYTNVVELSDLGDGSVSYTVTTPSGQPESLYGQFLLCFMDGDTCIFSADVDYEGPHEKDASLTGTYVCPYKLPAYTSIQVIQEW